MTRFVYNNILKPYEKGMPVFMPPTGEAFNEKEFAPFWLDVLRWLFAVGRLCAGTGARHALNAFAILVGYWLKVGSSGSVKSVPLVSNNACELQRIVCG